MRRQRVMRGQLRRDPGRGVGIEPAAAIDGSEFGEFRVGIAGELRRFMDMARS